MSDHDRAARRPRFPAAAAQAPAPQVRDRGVLRPQQPVHQAAIDARRAAAPSLGLGMDSLAVRRRMVDRLQRAGVRSTAVLQALSQVPRHEFVDSGLAAQAYEDTSLPIGHGQTISKPSVVARMLDLLSQGAWAQAHGSLGKVLEIGTGCGYQAALLSLLGASVVSIERIGPLHQAARQRLAQWRGAGLHLLWADGRLGHPPAAPFQSIIAAAGGEEIPPAWLEQLDIGGRLLAPVQSSVLGGHALLCIDRTAVGYSKQWLEPVHFVPLKSGAE